MLALLHAVAGEHDGLAVLLDPPDDVPQVPPGGRWLEPASLAGDLPGHGVHTCTRLVQEDQRWLPGLAVGRGGKGQAQDSHQGHGHIQLPLVATVVAS